MIVLGVIILGVFICIASLLYIFDPVFRGWVRLRKGVCPLCNSLPPSDLCNICHGETNYGRSFSPDRQEIWRERYRSYIYLKEEQ